MIDSDQFVGIESQRRPSQQFNWAINWINICSASLTGWLVSGMKVGQSKFFHSIPFYYLHSNNKKATNHHPVITWSLKVKVNYYCSPPSSSAAGRPASRLLSAAGSLAARSLLSPATRLLTNSLSAGLLERQTKFTSHLVLARLVGERRDQRRRMPSGSGRSKRQKLNGYQISKTQTKFVPSRPVRRLTEWCKMMITKL